MKKTLALSLMFLMSGCACLDGLCYDEDEDLTVVENQNAYKGYDNQGCNYLNGEDCVRPQRIQPRPIVYRQEQPIIYVKEVERPTPVIIRHRPAPVEPQTVKQEVVTHNTEEKVNETNKTFASCGDIKSTTKEYELNDNSHCAPQVKEVREPVEIVYRKTTYKTVYEPKTTKSVTYEKEPYKQEAQTAQTAQNVSTTTTVETTTTKTTDVSTNEVNSLDVLPAEEIK